jgi:hypothetical protein
MAAKQDLAVVAEHGHVVVTTPVDYREPLKKVSYTVKDLTGGDSAGLVELAVLVRKLIAPDSWRENNGRGTIVPSGDALSVLQTKAVHQRILVFCETLRLARGMPLRSRNATDQFTLATRTDRARHMLQKPVTANFHAPATLARILAYLSQATGKTILVDHAALASTETSDRMEGSVTARKTPLAKALDDLLQPLGLAYCVLDPQTILVTTKEAANERFELEFYKVDKLLEQGTSAETIIERAKKLAAKAVGDDVVATGMFYFDPPSKCLIILQPQAAQAAIERELEK